MTHRLQRSQLVGGDVASVFAFFSNPQNLQLLTPPWLHFHIESTSDAIVRTGTIIRYRLRLQRIPMHWSSRIVDHVDGVRFVDEQVAGPYRRWHHRHDFHEADGGVVVTDTVDYEMPLGALGQLAHVVFVRRQLADIFDYRALQMERLFPLPLRKEGQP